MKKWEGYQKGINFGGWFSQCDYSEECLEGFITEKDFCNVAEWGLDHVRIPVDYNIFEDNNGGYIEKGFDYIQRAIDWCGKYKLNMIIDLHKTAGFSFDAGEKEEGFFNSEHYQERFYRLWEQFAKRFGKYKDRVAFELLNEVTDKSYLDSWNRIADECIRRIRAIEPDVYILVGGYWNNSVKAVPDLNMPQDDKIIYNFHCYDPLIFTHQSAYWVENMPLDYKFSFDSSYETCISETQRILKGMPDTFPVLDNPDKPISSEYFRKLFEDAIKTARERNVLLYCGEYGVIDRACPQDAVKWFKEINKVFVENGIGRAAWCYRGKDFGFVDEHFKEVLDEVKQYM